jgi:hypothetical protein
MDKIFFSPQSRQERKENGFSKTRGNLLCPTPDLSRPTTPFVANDYGRERGRGEGNHKHRRKKAASY